MPETEKLLVNRENVLTVASQILQESTTVPSLPSVREHFETPTSPAIAVYFSEWRDINKDSIARLKATPAQLKGLVTRLETRVKELESANAELEHELFSFKDWIAANHPFVLTKWEDYGANAEQ